MLRVVAHDEILSRQQITELIGQLGDYHLAHREAAARRRPGLACGYRRLWSNSIYPISTPSSSSASAASSQRSGHSKVVPTVGRKTLMCRANARLAVDPATWLLLLERPEEAVRRTAARQLTAMLGEPIAVDPAADPETQKSQRERLRANFERPKRDLNAQP